MTDSKTIEDRWAEIAPKDQGVMQGVTPHLCIGGNRAVEAIGFYAKAFAATEAMPSLKADDGKRIMHAHLRINGGDVMLNDDFPEYMGGNPTGQPTAVTLHLNVDDADRWFDRAVQAGATPTMPLTDMFWGDRYGQVKDPFGHSWSIGAPSEKGA